MADAIRLLIDLKDPIGEQLETIEKENGLRIEKKRVPIGVIGMIYEARPNVTIDAATLSIKTGNAVILTRQFICKMVEHGSSIIDSESTCS